MINIIKSIVEMVLFVYGECDDEPDDEPLR